MKYIGLNLSRIQVLGNWALVKKDIYSSSVVGTHYPENELREKERERDRERASV